MRYSLTLSAALLLASLSVIDASPMHQQAPDQINIGNTEGLKPSQMVALAKKGVHVDVDAIKAEGAKAKLNIAPAKVVQPVQPAVDPIAPPKVQPFIPPPAIGGQPQVQPFVPPPPGVQPFVPPAPVMGSVLPQPPAIGGQPQVQPFVPPAPVMGSALPQPPAIGGQPQVQPFVPSAPVMGSALPPPGVQPFAPPPMIKQPSVPHPGHPQIAQPVVQPVQGPPPMIKQPSVLHPGQPKVQPVQGPPQLVKQPSALKPPAQQGLPVNVVSIPHPVQGLHGLETTALGQKMVITQKENVFTFYYGGKTPSIVTFNHKTPQGVLTYGDIYTASKAYRVKYTKGSRAIYVSVMGEKGAPYLKVDFANGEHMDTEGNIIASVLDLTRNQEIATIGNEQVRITGQVTQDVAQLLVYLKVLYTMVEAI